jgi:hypothetical protein
MAVAAPPVPDVRDARYWEQIARMGATTRDALLGIDKNTQLAQQDVDESIRRLMDDRGKALGETRSSANKEGLLYSGQLGKREGDVRTQYGRQETDIRSEMSRRISEAETEKTRLRNEQGEQNFAAFGEAGQRAYERDLANPPAPPTLTAGRTPKPPAAKPQFARNQRVSKSVAQRTIARAKSYGGNVKQIRRGGITGREARVVKRRAARRR